jgi:tRNA-binding protein
VVRTTHLECRKSDAFDAKRGRTMGSVALGRDGAAASRVTHVRPTRLSVRQAPKQIGRFMSEVLVLGFPDAKGEVVLIGPSHGVPNGGRLF